MATVRIKDHGYNALLKRLAGGAKAKVTVGVHEAEGAAPEGESGLSVAEVGTLHELGLGGQEERSFVRAYVDENEQQLNDDLRKIGQAVIKGTVSTTEQGLERFGLLVAAGMQKRISDGGVHPEDKPATVAKKGSSTPLLDDGILRSSITHKVEK